MDELPLLELFTRLREAGLPLGVNDYQAVLKALQAGYGLSDRDALARLCRMLWVRSLDERQLFDYYFEQLMGSDCDSTEVEGSKLRQPILLGVLVGAVIVAAAIVVDFNRSRQSVIVPPHPLPTKSGSPSSPSPQVIEKKTQNWDWLVSLLVLGAEFWLLLFLKRLQSTSKPIPESAIVPQTLHKMKDEVQIAQTVQSSREHFLLATDFLPVTQRQMKQNWRFLRRLIREGLSTELDLEATVQQIAQHGVYLEAVLIPPHVNRTELVLLIDQDGSMVPFQALSERLIETALRGGRLDKMGIYYFHNCPIEYFYHDFLLLNARPIQNALAQWQRDQTVVLIFSDAGAARGGLSLGRVEVTKEFLKNLKPQVQRMAWLNPMPRLRWTGTTAAEIAQFVPMFEATRQGLNRAIAVLRGRYCPTVKPLRDSDNGYSRFF